MKGLREGEHDGYDLAEAPHAWAHETPDPMEELVNDSCSIDEAAAVMNIPANSVLQQLEERNLYGFQLDGEWHIPNFQFGDQGKIPGVGLVVAALEPGIDPLLVSAWFWTPKPGELEIGDKTVSPIEWLATVDEVDPVVEMARNFRQIVP